MGYLIKFILKKKKNKRAVKCSCYERSDLVIKKIINEEASKIIDDRNPKGKFYTIEKTQENKIMYVGIDNTTGDAWTEEFESLNECKTWLGN